VTVVTVETAFRFLGIPAQHFLAGQRRALRDSLSRILGFARFDQVGYLPVYLFLFCS